MRLVVFGNSGAGKSALAKRLAADHGLVHLDLDTLVWEPGMIGVQRPMEAVRNDLFDFQNRHERWVIEGCYGELVALAAPRSTDLVLLDPGEETCIAHCLARPWEPHKYASKVVQDAMLPPLLEWVRGYYTRNDAWSRAGHLRVFDAFEGNKHLVEDVRDYRAG